MNIEYRTRLVLVVLSLNPLTLADDVLVRAGTVYTMTGEPLRPGAVLVSGGKIAKVASEIEALAGMKVIDVGSGALMPGLVDAYTHLGLDGGNSEYTREVTPGLRVLPSIDWRHRTFREALTAGTTTACVAPGTDNVFAGVAAVVKTASDAADTRVLARDAALLVTVASDPRGRNMSRTSPTSIYVRQPTNRMGVVWILRQTLDRARHDESPELAVVREALGKKRPLLAVSRQDFDLLALLRLSEEFSLEPIACGADESYKVARELAKARVPVILGPLSTATGRGTEGTEIAWNKAGVLHAAGVTTALSGGELLEQARFAHRFGLPRDAALAAITRVPAELLRLGDRVGSIADGRDADLVALTSDPLDLTARVRWVMVGGVIQYEMKE